MKENGIFVFGSNTAGIHGAGAARTALNQYGAKYGMGFGPQGKSFAIPTKNSKIQTLPLKDVRFYVNLFLLTAKKFQDKTFYVTKIGCGLAGYTDEEIAPMFEGASTNCIFDVSWKPYLGDEYEYFEGNL